ncbi:MAG: septal ring lytic transglycosylase RlpA family protein [Proteobacteria bacterium]|nr:septal ring lytic transglycosylase RlpA family protein [Pseudomonadota bacterium]
MKHILFAAAALAVCGCDHVANFSGDPVAQAPTEDVVVPKPEARGKFVVGKQYKVKGVVYKPRVDLRYRAEGMASWYGGKDGFHGGRTANGARYDMNGYTAAHKTLPLPSVVKVTNLENNKSLHVVINDRGPFRKGRIIDVSKKAAQDLGFLENGIAKVRVEYSHAQTVALLAHYPKTDREKAVGEYRLAATRQNKKLDVILN